LIRDPEAASRDLEAIARCLAGERDAFGDLVDRHQHAVFNIAYRMTGRREDAEDLAQDAFLKAYSALREFRGESSFRTWICQIATRVCIDHLRSRKETVELNEDLAVTADGPDLSTAVVDRQFIAEAIQSLPPHYRAAVILRHLEHRSYQEIADILRLPLATVKTHIRRARARLRERLAPVLQLPADEENET
jgi:RNA polymerase sigma-70 factor (ECF subfamily)